MLCLNSDWSVLSWCIYSTAVRVQCHVRIADFFLREIHTRGRSQIVKSDYGPRLMVCNCLHEKERRREAQASNKPG